MRGRARSTARRGSVAPGAPTVEPAVTCASDRKRFIVLQVKTMSSHHAVAGTRQWNSSAGSSGRRSRTSQATGSPQSAHGGLDPTVGVEAAQMPKASQAQFAYHDRPAAWTRERGRHGGERVGHADLPVEASNTMAWPSCRRCHVGADLDRLRRRPWQRSRRWSALDPARRTAGKSDCGSPGRDVGRQAAIWYVATVHPTAKIGIGA